MNKIEIKKTIKEITLKEAIEINSNLMNKLEDIVSNYIDYVNNNIDPEYHHYFGIGIVNTHQQFGSVRGFWNDDKNDYCVVGSGYYYANDFNCWCEGSNDYEIKEFAEKINNYIKGGKEKILQFNNEVEKINIEI